MAISKVGLVEQAVVSLVGITNRGLEYSRVRSGDCFFWWGILCAEASLYPGLSVLAIE